jgi:hypothetical protein
LQHKLKAATKSYATHGSAALNTDWNAF